LHYLYQLPDITFCTYLEMEHLCWLHH